MSNLIFAPLIRVSTDRQKKRGESLRTQRTQLENAITSLHGTVSQWYAGQESATPEHERKILDQLMQDAIEHKFDAVMVADPSRWSRDNVKSATNLAVLKQHGIRFYVGTTEYNLYDNNAELFLSMNAIMNQFQAKEQAKKSIQNRIERAKRVVPSKKGKLQCGRLPFGRRFNKDNKLEVIPEIKEKVEEMAKLYLYGNFSFERLAEKYKMNQANIHKILTKRCGDTWKQRFQNKDAGIDETVEIAIPRLLSQQTIDEIKARCQSRKTWEHGTYKYQYLLSRLIFDAETGYSLSGTPNAKGLRYYRPYKGAKHIYMINADVLESAVLDDLFEALSNNDAIYRAVFDGEKVKDMEDELKKQRTKNHKTLTELETKLNRFADAIGNYDGPDMKGFLHNLKGSILDTEKRVSELRESIKIIDNQIQTLPNKKEIETARVLIKTQLEKQIEESYFTCGHTLRSLSFEAKRDLLKLLFGGNDESGKRYGIYITLIDEVPKRYKFVAYGRLGKVKGWVGPKEHYFSDASEVYDGKDEKVSNGVAGIVKGTDNTEDSTSTSHSRGRAPP